MQSSLENYIKNLSVQLTLQKTISLNISNSVYSQKTKTSRFPTLIFQHLISQCTSIIVQAVEGTFISAVNRFYNRSTRLEYARRRGRDRTREEAGVGRRGA